MATLPELQCLDGSCGPVSSFEQPITVKPKAEDKKTEDAPKDDKGWGWNDTKALGGALLGLALPFSTSALAEYFKARGAGGKGYGSGYLPHVTVPTYHPTNYMNPMQQHPSSTSGSFFGAAYASKKNNRG